MLFRAIWATRRREVNPWREENGNTFSIDSKKEAFTSLFKLRPRKSGQGSEFSLEWCSLVIHAAHPAHAARTSRTRFFFLRQLRPPCFCGEHESGDRSGVLQPRADP